MSLPTPSRIKELIKSQALKAGFDMCGVSKSEFLNEEAPLLEKWLKMNMHGSMSYMENHFEKRLDPGKLVPGAKSVISLLYNYYPEEDLFGEKEYKIAKYAFGKDYHKVIKRKLKDLLQVLTDQIGDFKFRYFVDSAPVMERQWAEKSGLGWLGKNSLLINPKKGSYFFLAEIICDLDIEPDTPIKDFCGTCTKCMEACPTDAIPDPYMVDASKCISYLTIELKENIPTSFKNKYENWIFGCDICQDVCPWNSFSTPNSEKAFSPSQLLKQSSDEEMENMTEEIFDKIFNGSAVKRTKFEGLKRNIEFVKKNPRIDRG